MVNQSLLAQAQYSEAPQRLYYTPLPAGSLFDLLVSSGTIALASPTTPLDGTQKIGASLSFVDRHNRPHFIRRYDNYIRSSCIIVAGYRTS